MENMRENWMSIKEAVRKEYNLSDISYHTWIEPMIFGNIEDDMVTIFIPKEQGHALDYISSKYRSYFQVMITEMFDHPYHVVFSVKSDENGDEKEMPRESGEDNAFSESSELHRKYNFNALLWVKIINWPILQPML